MRNIDPDLYLREEREARAMQWDSEPIDTGDQYCTNCEAEMTEADLVVDDSECTKCVEEAWAYRREQGRGSPGNVGPKS